MDLEQEIKEILLSVIQDIKIHKIDSNNTVLEIDYDKHTQKIIDLINKSVS